MHLGFGLYKHMLDEQNLAFARQCGATHIVVHLVDYFNQASEGGARNRDNQPVNADGGCWGMAGSPDQLWSSHELEKIKGLIEAAGLKWYAIENFDPAHWHDVLLDGPRRPEQIENVKTLIRRVGKAGIPVIGYNFSLAGVYGRIEGAFARGGATSVGMDGHVDPNPVPDGIVWNMRLPGERGQGTSARACIPGEILWQRFGAFLEEVLPVAEAAGVRLALHPDDPPVERIRDTPRLVNHPDLLERVLDYSQSPSNALEFCLGTLAEMPAGDLYAATRACAARKRIAYVHFRNVLGTAPRYREVFIDEGSIDMARIVRILREENYDGVLIPDHTPQMTCAAPWHAGMAYAMGYMKALLAES
ncbi:MAG: mannonate dehydratase [Oceanipulchritudo sp.]